MIRYVPSEWVTDEHAETTRGSNGGRSTIAVLASRSIVTSSVDVVGSLMM